MTIRAPHLSQKRERRVQEPSAVPNLLVTTLAVAAVAAPFAQTDWPNPELVPTQQPLQLGMPLEILEDAGEKPFLQTEWPQPELLPPPIPEQVPKSIALVEPPFFQTEWPNPVSVELQHIEQTSKSIALVETIVGAPFFETQWPNPTLRVDIQTPFQIGLPLTILEDAGEKPFLQTEWPDPLAREIQQPETRGSFLPLTVEPGTPFFQPISQNPTQVLLVQTPDQINTTLRLISLLTPAAVVGGATALTEPLIVAGGQVITITLTDDVWRPAGTAFDQVRQIILNGLTSAQSETLGWNKEVRDKELIASVVRTSDTVVTITFTAAPDYDITVDEVITVTVPGEAVNNSTTGLVSTVTIGVTADAPILQTHTVKFSSVSRAVKFSSAQRRVTFNSVSRTIKIVDTPNPLGFILTEDDGIILQEDDLPIAQE